VSDEPETPNLYPYSVTDHAPEFAEAWRRFQHATSVRLLDETLESEWAHGRTDYAAFLVPVSDPGVRARIAATIRAISGIPGVEPYPEAYWHATIKGLGFMVAQPSRPDELSPADVQRMAEGARPILERQAPFRAAIGNVNAFAEVVFLEVLDGGVIRSLNQRLLAGIAGIRRQPVDGAGYLPHISIARFSSAEGLKELKEALAHLREEQPAGPGMTVREVLLIQAHLTSEAPAFETLAAYPLRG
jgi:2'-5' RNA ligase